MIKKMFLPLVLALPFAMYAQQKINIIPQPVSVQQSDGAFVIDINTR